MVTSFTGEIVLIHHVGYTTRNIRRHNQGLSVSRERKDTGEYTEVITLDALLGVFDTVDGPVVTSGDVADALDCSRETARWKLGALEKQGRVESRKASGRVVWWLVGSEPSDVDPADPFWDLDPGASGESDISERIDEVLYGEWFRLGPCGHTADCRVVSPGEAKTWTARAATGEMAPCDAQQFEFLGGGRYAAVAGYGHATPRSGALVEFDGPDVTAVPTDDVTSERSNGTVTATKSSQ